MFPSVNKFFFILCRIKTDEIKVNADVIDRNDIDILTHVLADFDIIGAIRIYSADADPDGM
jgi:hypothetical protein